MLHLKTGSSDPPIPDQNGPPFKLGERRPKSAPPCKNVCSAQLPLDIWSADIDSDDKSSGCNMFSGVIVGKNLKDTAHRCVYTKLSDKLQGSLSSDKPIFAKMFDYCFVIMGVNFTGQRFSL